jgi:POT family proton-dependent oligopeptide transporter
MTIFAEKFTQRKLFSASLFKIADALLTIMIIITYVLIKFKQTKKYALGNLILSSSFVIICIVIWKVGREYAAESTEVPATWFGILNSLFIVGFRLFFKMVGK